MKAVRAIVWILILATATGVSYWLCTYTARENNSTMESSTQRLSAVSPREGEYCDLLPDTALLVLRGDLPGRLIEKMKDSSSLFSLLLFRVFVERLGYFDVTDPQEYKERGIATEKPFGVALLDLEPTRTSTNPLVLFFIGVSDERKFDALVREMFVVMKLEIEEKKIGGTPCVLLKQKGATTAVYGFRSGFWVFYVDASRCGVEEKFQRMVLSSEKRLSKNRNFQTCLKNIEKEADLYFFLNITRMIATVKAHNYSVGDLLEQWIPPDVQGLSMAMSSQGRWRVDGYLNCGGDFLSKNPESCQELLDALPQGPVFCLTCNLDIAERWDKIRDSLDHILPAVVESLRPHLPPLMEEEIPVTLKQAMQKANAIIAEELGETVDLEQSLILNLQGNAAIIVYRFSSPKAVDFDAVVALKLKEPGHIETTIDRLMAALEKRCTVGRDKIYDTTIFTIALRDLQIGDKAVALSPTFGVFRDYLVFTSQKETFRKMLVEEGQMLGNLGNKHIASRMEQGDPLVAYLNIRELAGQIADSRLKDSLTPFQELTWHTWSGPEGIHTVVELTIAENALDFILQYLKSKEFEKLEHELQKLPGAYGPGY